MHAFTASGSICALFAALAVFEGRLSLAFVWLGIAFVIDGIDGTFARAVDVKRRLPRYSGERLDLIVDFTTYVFVPVLMLERVGYLAGATGIVLASAILLSSLYHFVDDGNKSEDNCFVGFPAIWNVVAFYLLAFAVPPGWAAAVILVCSALAFVPMRWLHPMRVAALAPLNVAAMLAWSVAAGVTVSRGFPAQGWPRLVLAAVLLYGLALTAWWSWQDWRARRSRPKG